MTGTPKPLKCRLGECRDFRSELRRHGILHCHMRPVAASSAQSLPCQERFRSHPVCVVGSDKGAVHVTTCQGRGSSGLDPQHCPHDQSLSQRSEIVRLKALQAIPVDEELDGLFSSRPAHHALSRRHRDIDPSAVSSNACRVDDAAESLVVGVVVALDDALAVPQGRQPGRSGQGVP
jgi:hypothetical protein